MLESLGLVRGLGFEGLGFLDLLQSGFRFFRFSVWVTWHFMASGFWIFSDFLIQGQSIVASGWGPLCSIAAFGQKSRQERRLKVKPLAKLPILIPGFLIMVIVECIPKTLM